ncbi:hypothetical protein [Lentzea sp. NPDC051838]|uniref:hypothetical protein n=1 Tax=Lentzea sp. NPDC051838 TaxID=3154849 RepID=UPI0034220FEC
MRATSRGIDKKRKSAVESYGEVKIEPGQSGELLIGYFEQGMPEPELDVSCVPDVGEDMGRSLDRLNGVGEYELIYHFTNFGAVPSVVTVTGRPEGWQR